MARIGKIARLPRAVRSLLNSRLEDGQDGKQILTWLNNLPTVRDVLKETFHGNPVNDQNLSEWRQGGFQEWLATQNIAAQAAELAANRVELQETAPGQSPADLLAAAVTFRYSAILAAQGPELDQSALIQLRALGHVCQAVVKLRRSEQDAARLKMETERWEVEGAELRAENQEAEKRRLRAALSARILSAMKVTEWHDKLGGGPRAGIAASILREIEACPDPAHFHSQIIGDRTPEEWDRYVEEQVKKAPPRMTEIEAAAKAVREMDAALGIRELRSKRRRAAKASRLSRSATRRPARKPEQTNSAPPPAGAEDVASSVPLDPPPIAPTPPAVAALEINPIQPYSSLFKRDQP